MPWVSHRHSARVETVSTPCRPSLPYAKRHKRHLASLTKLATMDDLKDRRTCSKRSEKQLCHGNLGNRGFHSCQHWSGLRQSTYGIGFRQSHRQKAPCPEYGVQSTKRPILGTESWVSRVHVSEFLGPVGPTDTQERHEAWPIPFLPHA